MPIFNLMGGREVSGDNSENYKSKITEYMKADGYFLVADSSDRSMLPDQIFKCPPREGKTEIWVEAKYTDLSITNSDFQVELARYFIEYMQRELSDRFDLYFFIRTCQGWTRWRHVFDTKIWKKSERMKLYEKIQKIQKLADGEKEKLSSLSFEDFHRFLNDIYIFQVTYDGLVMKIDKFESTGKYDVESFYLREDPVLEEKERIKGNFAEISEFPENIYISKLKKVDQRKILVENAYYLPFWLKSNVMYSLFPVEESPESLQKYIGRDCEEKDFMEWFFSDSTNKNITKILFKKYACQKGISIGCSMSEYKDNTLFFAHENLDEEITSYDGRQVSRYFKDSSLPFVKHKGVRVDVKNYRKRFYLFLTPVVLFSNDGKNLITGSEVKKIYEKFSPNRYDTNQKVLREFESWFEWLGFSKVKVDSQSFCTTKPIVSDHNCRPPKNSDERNLHQKNRRFEEFQWDL